MDYQVVADPWRGLVVLMPVTVSDEAMNRLSARAQKAAPPMFSKRECRRRLASLSQHRKAVFS